MYEPSSFYRRDALIKHPPYGLYLDPHRGQHNWTAASTRVLLGLLLLLTPTLIVAFALSLH
jgi:hypothetical protein